MKRLTVVLAIVLAFGLAVPASAATWRGYASVRSDRGVGAVAGGTANKVADIQIGVYTYGRARTVTWDASFFCARGANTSSRDKSGQVTTTARTWTWIWVRNGRAVQDFCDTTAFVEPNRGAIRLKIRVK